MRLATAPARRGAAASRTVTLVALVSPSAADGSTLTDRAPSTSTATDNDANTNTATFGTTVGAAADLAVRKAGPAAVTAGANAAYALTLTNSGPGDAQGVTLSDAVPAGATFVSFSRSAGPPFNLVPPAGGTGTLSASAPALAAGASATFSLVLKASAGGPQGSTLSNTANVTSSTADSNTANDSSTATATVATLADLAVAVTGPAAVTAGTNVTYTLRVTNAGPGDARAVPLTDSLRAGLSFLSAGAGGGAGKGSSAALGARAAGAGTTVTLLALAGANVPAGHPVADDVLATRTAPGAVNTNNTATALGAAQARPTCPSP
jgi:uncharacterized repeat protein (TIGR01451 family)